MKMKQVCEITGLTEKAVRFYIQQDLIKPEIEEGVHRKSYSFTEENVDVLKSIAVLRKAGFSISDIRMMMEEPEQLPSILEERQMLLNMEIQHSQAVESAIERLSPWEKGDFHAIADSLKPIAGRGECKQPVKTHRVRNIVLLSIILILIALAEYVNTGGIFASILVIGLCALICSGIGFFMSFRYAFCGRRAEKMDEKGTGVIIDVVKDTGFDVAFARAGSTSAGTKEPGIGGIWQIVMMFWNEIRPDSWYPVLQYKNSQGDIQAATFTYGWLKYTWKCGEKVKIAWNPQQPEKVYPLEGTWMRKKAIGYLIVSVISLVASVILLYGYGTVIGL